MAIITEYINCNSGINQDLIVDYNSTQYVFKIRFNEYFNYWYFDLYLYNNNILVLSGIKLKLMYNCFSGLGLNLGELYLVDTIEDNGLIDIKNDFGNRLKLKRIYSND